LLESGTEIDVRRFPTVHRLADGLAQDRWAGEFEAGLEGMLDRIAGFLGQGPGSSRPSPPEDPAS
jgi:hypothetical protein